MFDYFKICLILITDLISQDLETQCGQEPILIDLKQFYNADSSSSTTMTDSWKSTNSNLPFDLSHLSNQTVPLL